MKKLLLKRTDAAQLHPSACYMVAQDVTWLKLAIFDASIMSKYKTKKHLGHIFKPNMGLETPLLELG